jgi:hypothetical protein
MPSPAQRNTLAYARSQKSASPAPVDRDIEEKLHLATQQIAELSLALEYEQSYSASLAEQLDAEKLCSQTNFHKFRVEQRARQRGEVRRLVLEEKIKSVKVADVKRSESLKKMTAKASAVISDLLRLEKENSSLRNELLGTLQRYTDQVAESQHQLKLAGRKLVAARQVTTKLQKWCKRAAGVKEKAVQKAKEQAYREKSFHSLLKQGVYTEDTRNLIQLLVQAGCARDRVSKAIHAVFRVAGISVKGTPCRRTVSRIILEGYFAAQLQIAYEMQDAKGTFLFDSILYVLMNIVLAFTLGSNGTARLGIGYTAHHAHYQQKTDDGSERVTRFLGIHSPLDGTSEQSVVAWKELFRDITDLYNQSPLGKRSGALLHVISIFVKLSGMHSDHCSEEKKDAHLMQKEKMAATYQMLGKNAILEESDEEFRPAFLPARKKMIKAVGGEKQWELCLRMKGQHTLLT